MTMHRPKWRRNAWLVAAATVLLVQGFAWLLERGWLHAPLERRLAVAFGRPVAVQSFSVGLFGGLRLQANQITVGEDPAFGPEHFLRAEQLAAGLRWTALLAGRLEFDTLVLKRPSLNLVRNPDSHWNLESWLPPAAGGRGTPRFSRLVVEEGRINFKRGPDKLSVALRNNNAAVLLAAAYLSSRAALPSIVMLLIQQPLVWVAAKAAASVKPAPARADPGR